MSTPSIAAGQVLGHYRLIEKIGGGGQGEVYRAHDERIDRDVAVKILPFKVLPDDAARRRFRKEALAVGKLTHPNIATAYYFGEENGVDFLVTEYVAGTGLDEKLEHGAIPEESVVKLGIQLASGLQAAHHEGIVHRDLKPGNLRITQDGHLKILDFGLAELIDPTNDVASVQTVTVNMTLTGTIPYMAPEQFGGVCDQRTDLWAVGAVLYEMATGQLPFVETQVQALKDAILSKEPARPSSINPTISPGLETVILRALQKDPNRRYQTASDLRDDLIRIARGKRVKRDWQLHRTGLRAAAAVVLAGILGFATYHFWPRPRTTGSEHAFRVLAVLPIESGSQDPAEIALGRGVAETVSARIAQGTNGRAFQLIPPTELTAQGVKTAEQARHEFNVDLVLFVGLQHAGEKMRITCSLIDPSTHQQVDARTVTGEASDLFNVEDNAVTEVFGMLPKDVRTEQPTPTEVLAAVPAGYEYYVRGRGYLQEYQKPENIDAAIKQFEQALKVSPNYAPAYAGLGDAYWQGYESNRGKDWLDKAKTNCEKALATDPKLAAGHTCLGSVYLAHGEYDKALSEIQRAIALDPSDVHTVLVMGDTYDKLKDYAQAEATFKRAISLSPNYWSVYTWAGFFYFGHAKYADAESMYRKASELAPGNQRPLYNLGAMYLLEGRYQEAIDAFQRSIQLRPTMSAYGNLGTAYFYLREYPDAIAAYEKARALDEKYFMNWGNVGDALYWSPARRAESVAAYKRAIELGQAQLQVNPKDAVTRAFVASYYAMSGDKRPATTELNKALNVAPQDPDVLFRASLIYNQLGDDRQTLDWLKKAVAANFSRTTVRDTPDFDHLKSNPAFQEIITGRQ
jgi:tetratricopeptide (TPR) repeat protein/tRNA A-37 threonylcarbamoyl transferase component Bud32/TolB-like protein